MKIDPDQMAHDTYRDHHLIRTMTADGGWSSWRLVPKGGGRMESTDITFTPDQIIVHGDLCPAHNGVISTGGYGIGWFGSSKSPGYLCEKFLVREWQAEVAAEEIGDWLEHQTDYEIEGRTDVLEALIDIRDSLISNEAGDHDLYAALDEIDRTAGIRFHDDGIPGYDYPRQDAALLVACQAAFARLYQVWQAGYREST